MDSSPARTLQRRPKKLGFRRDSYWCIVTGAVELSVEHGAMYATDEIATTELALTILFSLGQWDNDRKKQAVAQILPTLKKGFPSMDSGPTNVNKPKNLMTLVNTVHTKFGPFCLALEPATYLPFEQKTL
ncbi:hypothetical protein L228DRAFT_248742 [Xylona heveae TC161]|uniref:Uncharacterized protein n=1 Tax=Xylona heveae (strain CBS 132557 / TC161) TaxID=1328760 RepID=A0A165FHS6_XYLHT|nr:hypothetical protein L228DRAFT_248742 [Xylona heveae TC161]KZF20994.1 hypothetical protein L228DRAFT_248742 [Xylona heveae TC161]